FPRSRPARFPPRRWGLRARHAERLRANGPEITVRGSHRPSLLDLDVDVFLLELASLDGSLQDVAQALLEGLGLLEAHVVGVAEGFDLRSRPVSRDDE